MNITVEQKEGRVPVTVMHLSGDLDGSNYQDVITRAQEIANGGAKYLLIDMEEVPFMGSSGLVALHSITLLMRGEKPPDPEAGWAAFRTVRRDVEFGLQEHVKLLRLQPSVERSLEKTGMTAFFEIHTDLEEAIASF
jgi:anti-anti-sigma regulatory factor